MKCLQMPVIGILFSTLCNAQVNSGLSADSLIQKIVHESQPRLVKSMGTGPSANVHCGLQDRAGNLWFGTTGEGLYRYDGKGFINFTADDGLAGNEVWCIYEDKENNLWIGTGNGVCRYNSSAVTGRDTFFIMRVRELPDSSRLTDRLRVPDPSVRNAVWSIFQDKTGIFWFGTSEGMFCYDGTSLTPFLQNENIINPGKLHLKHIQAIVQDRIGNLWFASWNQEGAIRFDGKTLTSFRPNDDGMVHALLEDKNGILWAGTRNNGASQYENETFINVVDTLRLSKEGIYSMTEDQSGNIWFATESSGVWCYHPSATLTEERETFTNYTTNDGLCHNSVFSVLADHSGKIWFGTRNTDLCSFDGVTFTDFSE